MNSQINWNRIYAITLLNSAIIICWIAYHYFQPKLLTEFGLLEAANTLDFAKNFTLVLIPPLAGLIADRFSNKSGSRYLVFTVGISFTAFIFLASSYIFLDIAPDFLKAKIPLFMVLWLIGMNIFYSPATGFLLKSAKGPELPIVVASVSLAANILFAAVPLLEQFFEKTGSSFTFFLGALLLLAAAWFYKRMSVDDSQNRENLTIDSSNRNLLLPLIVGLSCGFTNLAVDLSMSNANEFFGGFDLKIIVYVLAALAVIPLAKALKGLPSSYGFKIALISAIVSALFLYILTVKALIIVLLIAISGSLCLFEIFAFSLALSGISSKQTNLGAGIFLGAFSLPFSIWSLIGF
jgi:MFS family permease